MSLSIKKLTVPCVAIHSSALSTPTAVFCSSRPSLQRDLASLQSLLRLEVNSHLCHLNNQSSLAEPLLFDRFRENLDFLRLDFREILMSTLALNFFLLGGHQTNRQVVLEIPDDVQKLSLSHAQR